MPMQFMINQTSANRPVLYEGQPMPDSEKETKQTRGMLISLDELIKARESGASWVKLEAMSGISAGAIRHRLRSAGAWNPTRVRVSDEQVSKAVEMRSLGVPWVEIEKQLGRTESSIRWAVKTRRNK